MSVASKPIYLKRDERATMTNQQLLTEGLTLLNQVQEQQPTAVGDTAVAQRLHTSPYLTATFIAERLDTADISHANLVKLVEKVDRYFNKSELRDLCFQLGVDDEDFGNIGKRDKARELVLLMDRHGRLTELVQKTAALRSQVSWQDTPQQSGGVEIVSRLDVAVVVDITRPTALDVARYLDEEETAVNFLLLKNAQPDAFLNATEKWNPFIKSFSQTMNIAKHSFSGSKPHFFLSAPGALLFGLGCIWGTVDEAVVYHYEKGTYYPTIFVSRTLR